MPDFIPEIRHEALEADMKHLAAEVQRFRERPEMQNVSGQELLKRSIQSLSPAQLQDEAKKEESSSGPLPSYTIGAPAETKLEIEYLLDLAFHKGIAAANAEAAKSSPFVLDAFHDALVGKLYPELQKRGILK